MASKNCHQPRIATIKSNFAKHDWKSQEKTIHWALVNGQVPSLRNIILISEESKPGTVRFDNALTTISHWKKSVVNWINSKKRYSGSRTWWAAPVRGQPRWWLTSPIRSGWTMPAIFRCGERKRDIDINPIFVLDSEASYNHIFNFFKFTSGTTGNPKGVTLSHHNLVNNAFNIGHRVGYDQEVSSWPSPSPTSSASSCSLSCSQRLTWRLQRSAHTWINLKPWKNIKTNLESWKSDLEP